MTLKRSSTARMQESSIVKSNFKKTKLSDSAALGSDLTSKEYSKLKKAGKTGNVNLNRIKADNPIVKSQHARMMPMSRRKRASKCLRRKYSINSPKNKRRNCAKNADCITMKQLISSKRGSC